MSGPSIPLGNSGLPMMSGQPPILLPPEAADASAALEQALQSADAGRALRSVAARWPTFIEGWARLGDFTYREGKDVEAFAFYRTGYHRGLDRLRQNGWRGIGYVPWAHVPNRGVLRAVHGLMLASAALGEAEEARRCRQFLLDSDPADPFRVASMRPEALDVRPAPRPEPAG